MTQSAYRATVRITGPSWEATFDTGYLAAIGDEYETSEYVTHIANGRELAMTDSFDVMLIDVSRETSSFWPELGVQFSEIVVGPPT